MESRQTKINIKISVFRPQLSILIIAFSVLLLCPPVWAKNALELDTIWIPSAYQDAAVNAIEQEPTTIPEHTLLLQGLAIVLPLPDTEQDILYELEEQARTEQRGLWARKQYAIKTPETVVEYQHSFQIVDGTIVDAHLQKDQLYLNFGEDWKTDFTIAIPKSDLYYFRKANLTPQDWTGKNIRVRGWVEKYNGPMIKVTHPVQIKMRAD